MKLSKQASLDFDLSVCAKQALANSAIEGHEVSRTEDLQAIEDASRMVESGEAAAIFADLEARFPSDSSRDAAQLFSSERNAPIGGTRVEDEKLAELGANLERLTPREREVLRGIVRGLPNKVIAAELGTCEQTVKVHRMRVMEKTGVGSLAELVHAVDQLSKDPAICTPKFDRHRGADV